MVDRCGFIASLSSSSGTRVEDYILNHFEEVMLLYDIFGNFENLHISVDKNIINPFNISFTNEKDALEMNNLINGTTLHIYGDKYFIGSEVINNKLIKVTLTEYASMV